MDWAKIARFNSYKICPLHWKENEYFPSCSWDPATNFVTLNVRYLFSKFVVWFDLVKVNSSTKAKEKSSLGEKYIWVFNKTTMTTVRIMSFNRSLNDEFWIFVIVLLFNRSWVLKLRAPSRCYKCVLTQER